MDDYLNNEYISTYQFIYELGVRGSLCLSEDKYLAALRVILLFKDLTVETLTQAS